MLNWSWWSQSVRSEVDDYVIKTRPWYTSGASKVRSQRSVSSRLDRLVHSEPKRKALTKAVYCMRVACSGQCSESGPKKSKCLAMFRRTATWFPGRSDTKTRNQASLATSRSADTRDMSKGERISVGLDERNRTPCPAGLYERETHPLRWETQASASANVGKSHRWENPKRRRRRASMG